jgi:hypothetical protein
MRYQALVPTRWVKVQCKTQEVVQVRRFIQDRQDGGYSHGKTNAAKQIRARGFMASEWIAA